MVQRIRDEIRAEVTYFKALDTANLWLYNIRLLLAITYTGFAGFMFVTFGLFGEDASMLETVYVYLLLGCIIVVVFLLIFPPRLIVRNGIVCAAFVLVNAGAIVLPIMLNVFGQHYENGRVELDAELLVWFVWLMLMPSITLLTYWVMNRKKVPQNSI